MDANKIYNIIRLGDEIDLEYFILFLRTSHERVYDVQLIHTITIFVTLKLILQHEFIKNLYFLKRSFFI